MAEFQQVMHFRPEEVEKALRDALDLVEKIAPPEELVSIAFEKAVQMLTAKTLVPDASKVLPAILHGPHPGKGLM